jgi:small-conductance mechanosensitive channel/CRP-like cAMP-binding protein
MDLWSSFQGGLASRSQAIAAALTVTAVSLLAILGLVRPFLRFLLSREDERTRSSGLRRRVNIFLLTAVVLGLWTYLHAVTPPELRSVRLRHQLAELALIAVGGYALAELSILFFLSFVPRLRGRLPVAAILQDLSRALAAVALFLVGVRQAFPTADIAALITTSAILSIVLGLALQESLSNVFAGIMLTVDRPYKPGDWIEIDGREGKVLDSNWRSTRLLTREDDVIYVPNSTLAKSNVTNFSAPDPIKMIKRIVGIEYGAPPNRVRSVLGAMMKAVDGVLAEPAPDVFVKDYGDSAVLYELRFWLTDYDRRSRIESEVMRGVWYHLKRAGISIPFPIRDVTLRREKVERKPEETLQLLRKVDILRPLKEDELLLLAQDLGSQLFARGERVCRQGEAGSTFYIIRSGTIVVKVRDEKDVDTEVARLGPGACFGEMSLLTGEPRSSTCEAGEDCELLCLDRESFEVLLQENPAVAQSMSEILGARAQATKDRLAQERDTLVRRKAPEGESAAQKIFDKIRTIFRFRK